MTPLLFLGVAALLFSPKGLSFMSPGPAKLAKPAATPAKAKQVAVAAMKTRSRSKLTKGVKWLQQNGYGATARVVVKARLGGR